MGTERDPEIRRNTFSQCMVQLVQGNEILKANRRLAYQYIPEVLYPAKSLQHLYNGGTLNFHCQPVQ